ncbi:MAG: DUF3301 domain-containing protein [Thiobacillus sp.]
MSAELLLLAGAGALAWYWYAGLQAREIAILAGRRVCGERGVQFLDESVALTRTRFSRNGDGQLQFQRDYRFEFSDTGDNRRPASIRMVGYRIEWVQLDGEWQANPTATVTSLHD